MELYVKELGLAAYIAIKGGILNHYDNASDSFVFITDKDINAWRVEYFSSESYQHDSKLLSLRTFKTKKKNF
jgi:hypothetical protein